MRAAALDGRKRDPDRVPVGNGQIIDGDLPGTDFLESHPTIRTEGLATTITKHRDLHADIFHENLTHDAPGEPEQLLDVE